MLEIFATSGLIIAIVAVTFGVLVIAKNWKESGNRIFFYMTLALFVWGFSYWRWLSASDAVVALYWIRLLSLGSIFIPVFFFHWLTKFLNKEQEHFSMLIAVYVTAFFISLFAYSNLFIDGVHKKMFFPFWPDPGLLYSAYFLVLYVGLILYSLWILIRAFRSKKDREVHGRILYVLLGSILSFGGGISNFFLWYNIYVPPYGNFLVAAFPFLLGYSILKHGLFSLKTIAAEILVFFICVVLLIEVITSDTGTQLLLRSVFLATVAGSGYLLIKSVYREIQQREEIERLSNDKSEFMTFASHEIRNPITAMRGYASLVIDGTLGEAPAEIKDSAKKILVLGDEVLSLISQFLNKSKIELGQISYSIKDVDVGASVASIADGYVPHAALKGLMLNKDVDQAEDLHVKADEGKLKEVIGNIIDNSLKYTKHGNITVSAHRHGVHVRIEVSDTGVGVSPEILPHLFKKFSRADAQKVNLLGTGVGLYLAKTFIEGMGARIWAESDGKDKGSRFIIEFTTG